MTAQSATKATIPVGSDGWNPVVHIKQLSETTRSVVPVADQAERDGLAATFPGGVLPIPTYVGRMDRSGDIEVWTGSAWRASVETSAVTTTDTNWAYIGQLSRVSSTDGKRTVTVAERMSRVAGGTFPLGSTPITGGETYRILIPAFIPPGWRPAATFNGWALLTAGDDVPRANVWWRINVNGDLLARIDYGTVTVNIGDKLHLSGNWTTA